MKKGHIKEYLDEYKKTVCCVDESGKDSEKHRIVSEGFDAILNCFENEKLPQEYTIDLTLAIPLVWEKLEGRVDIDTFLDYFTCEDKDVGFCALLIAAFRLIELIGGTCDE